MIHSARFIKLAQLLFTSTIDDDEINAAKDIIDRFDKIELDLDNWHNSVENNLAVFNNYHGKETALVVISDAYDKTLQKLKQKYEKIIADLKQAIELIIKIQDVEMQEMIANITKASEEYTEFFNKLNDLPVKIGEVGFMEQFKSASQVILDRYQSFVDVLEHVKEYIKQHILGEQSLS